MADETVRPARLYISLVSNLANYGLKLLPLASIHTGAAATREGPAHHAETFRPLAGPYQEPLTFAVLLLKASASLILGIVKLDWLLTFGSLTDASNVRASVPLTADTFACCVPAICGRGQEKMGLLKRIYDWLLSLFWYVSDCCPMLLSDVQTRHRPHRSSCASSKSLFT